MMNIFEDVGSKIKELRKSHGLTLAVLAKTLEYQCLFVPTGKSY